MYIYSKMNPYIPVFIYAPSEIQSAYVTMQSHVTHNDP